MLGAIIGDIVGSRFEFNNTSDFDFELFAPACDFTDDTICTHTPRQPRILCKGWHALFQS